MNNPERFSVTPEKVTVELIEQEIYHVSTSEKIGLLLGILRREPGGRYLVFCNTKAVAERLEGILNTNGFPTAVITGDIPQKKRMKVLSQFKDGDVPILVATDVASRGLHIEGVTHVINYDLPQDPQDYVHRIGRTARAGAVGKAISLACEEYVEALPDIEDYIKQKIPVAALTDEMIVTDYKKRPRYAGKASPFQQRISREGRSREFGRRERPSQTSSSRRNDKTPRRHKRRSSEDRPKHP